jgi:predicted Rossmann fold nucleotide-binding protein DprA/Smf involved in DNA uptake
MPYDKFSGQNAMIRNKLVCALSKAVIVISSGPERDSNGKMSGTFDAGLTALKHKIPLFVVNPSLLNPTPQGNIDLIKMGGIPLSNGNELVQYLDTLDFNSSTESISIAQNIEQPAQTLQEPQAEYQIKAKDDIRKKILDLFNSKPLSVNEIIEQACLNWTPQKLTAYLKKIDEIEIVKKGRINYYKRKNLQAQPKLF